jgi:hypothetical protein
MAAMYTNEQALIISREHLIKQKARSECHGACKYRYNGLMCAIGPLIPEDLYNAYEHEHTAVVRLVTLLPTVFEGLNLKQLHMAQRYHDAVFHVPGFDYSYYKWIQGDELHHPDLAFKAIEEYHKKWDSEMTKSTPALETTV